MLKRIISVLLSMAFLIPALSFDVHAEGYNGSSKKAFNAGVSFDDYVVSEILNFNPKIDISAYVTEYGWNDRDALDAMNAIIYKYPVIYAFNNDYYEYAWNTGIGAYDFKVTYLMNKGTYKSTKDDFEESVSEILSLVDDSMSDAYKALIVHDYLVANTVYASNEKMRYSMYGCIEESKAVCQGYAQAFSYIMNLLGIECHVIKSEEMWHSWNYIKIDGKYYHVDLTFDDPTIKKGEKEYDLTGQVLHDYFLISDSKIKKTHYGWKFYSDGIKKTTGKKYDNYFWTNIRSQIIRIGNYLYYMEYCEDEQNKLGENATKLIRRSIKTNKTKVLKTIYCNWSVGDSDRFYLQTYARLSHYNGRLYFNTDEKVYSIDKNGKNLKTVCSPKLNGYSIFGSYVDSDGKLLMACGKEENDVPIYKKKTLKK